MASIKIVLIKHKQKKDGSLPIAIRMIKNRKPSYIFTGEYILEKDWNYDDNCARKSYPNSTRLNSLLLKKLRDAHAALLETEAGNDNLSTKQIKKKVKRQSSSVSFFQLATERIKSKYMEGVFSVSNAELSILCNMEEFLNLSKTDLRQKIIEDIQQRRKTRISKARKNSLTIDEKFKDFSKIKTLMFEDIDTAFINRYKNFCASYLDQKTRTVTNQLIFIRTLYNLAIKENIIDNKNYPFAGEKEQIRIKSGNKIGLTKVEIIQIENIELEEHTSIWHTRNAWLFAYYFAGVRISDVLEMKWSDFVDGRLYYQMNKNEKPVSLKTPAQALKILGSYKANKTSNADFIFPFLKKADRKSKEDIFKKTRNATKLLNDYLKKIAALCGIEKNLSNHIARHSFGNIAGDAINPLMLQKLYRHSSLKTTINYQANFIHKDADDALEQVLNS